MTRDHENTALPAGSSSRVVLTVAEARDVSLAQAELCFYSKTDNYSNKNTYVFGKNTLCACGVCLMGKYIARVLNV